MKFYLEMEMCMTLFLLMMILPTSLAQEDLKGKVFLFPRPSYSSHVLLSPNITKPLEEISVCLQFYSKFERTNILFSLAAPGTGNELYISESVASATVRINQQSVSFTPDSQYSDWRHMCVTWDSGTGVIQLWVNGKLYPRSTIMKGSSIAGEARVLVGQDSGAFNGLDFNSPSFVGEISDMNMWDYVLTPREIQRAQLSNADGNVINWRALVYELKGEVLVQPKLQCRVPIFQTFCE